MPSPCWRKLALRTSHEGIGLTAAVWIKEGFLAPMNGDLTTLARFWVIVPDGTVHNDTVVPDSDCVGFPVYAGMELKTLFDMLDLEDESQGQLYP